MAIAALIFAITWIISDKFVDSLWRRHLNHIPRTPPNRMSAAIMGLLFGVALALIRSLMAFNTQTDQVEGWMSNLIFLVLAGGLMGGVFGFSFWETNFFQRLWEACTRAVPYTIVGIIVGAIVVAAAVTILPPSWTEPYAASDDSTLKIAMGVYIGIFFGLLIAIVKSFMNWWGHPPILVEKKKEQQNK